VRAAEAALASAPWSSPVQLEPAAPAIAGELAELRDHYLNLPRDEQQALLEEARRRRHRR
jgi:hypothetical protein